MGRVGDLESNENQDIHDSERYGLNPYISLEQLTRHLRFGYSLCDDGSERVFNIHPQDTELILLSAKAVSDGGDTNIVAPHLNSSSLAFLVRAIAVGTANRHKLVIYSPDPLLRKLYRRLSYLGDFDTPIYSVYPLRRVGQYSNRITLCVSNRELSSLRGDLTLIFDARLKRGWTDSQPPPWGQLDGPKVILTYTDDHPILRSNLTFRTAYCRGCAKIADNWPYGFKKYAQRLNNYSSGVSITPQTIPGENSSLIALEVSLQKLLTEAKGLEQIQFQLVQAQRVNHFLQNTVLPMSFYQRAANGLGQYWIAAMLSSVRTALSLEIPAIARAALRSYIYTAEQALRDLDLRHAPKVEWFKQFMLSQKTEGQVLIYCRTKIEEDAVEGWRDSTASAGCAALSPISRAHLKSDGYPFTLIVPGPPSVSDSSLLMGGISSRVRVLAYSWQAKHWNLIRNRTSKLLAEFQPLPEPSFGENHPDLTEISWKESPLESIHDASETLAREFRGERRPTFIPTNRGTFEYDEESLVPTLEVDRFVDRPARLLQKGDVIIIRTGGNVIDARKTVDELAKTSPVLADAALQASIWHMIFAAYVTSKNMKYRDLHSKLFPKNEVSFQSVKGWISDSNRISPNRKNLMLLLSKIGISDGRVEAMLETVHVYRGYRMKVYNHLYRIWKRYASKLYEYDESEELELDRVDTEFGLTLAALEDLITFAEVLDSPYARGNPAHE